MNLLTSFGFILAVNYAAWVQTWVPELLMCSRVVMFTMLFSPMCWQSVGVILMPNMSNESYCMLLPF